MTKRSPRQIKALATRSPSLRIYVDVDGITEFEPPIGSPAIFKTRKTKLHQYSPKEVAEELSLMDAELLRGIAPEELENGAWMKKDKFIRAPNILAMVHASNDLAMLVPTEILNEETVPAMAKCISAYIKIASKCYRLNNYNSLKAILAGLQCTPIYRLKKTWHEVPSKRRKKFDTLSRLMSEEHNWKAYSRHLNSLLKKNTPCIPFLGVLLTITVQHESLNAVNDLNSELTVGDPKRSKKISGVEDYTVLEAITVRNRLEYIRKRSSSWRRSLPYLESEMPCTQSRQASYPSNEHDNNRLRANALVLDNDSDSDSDSCCEVLGIVQPAAEILSDASREVNVPRRILHHSISSVSDDGVENESLHEHQAYDNGHCENGELVFDDLKHNQESVKKWTTREMRKSKARSRLSEVLLDIPSDIESDSDSEENDTSDEGPSSEPSLGLVPSRSFDGLINAFSTWGFNDHKSTLTRVSSLSTLSSTSVATSEYSTCTESSSDQSTSSILSSVVQPVAAPTEPSTSTTQINDHAFSTGPYPPISPLGPMRNRSSVIGLSGSKRRVSVIQNVVTPSTRHSRVSQDAMPSQRSLKTRRRPSRLLNISNASSNPLELLGRYQFMSFGCSGGIQSNFELRELITGSLRNTEGQNYRLSYITEQA